MSWLGVAWRGKAWHGKQAGLGQVRQGQARQGMDGVSVMESEAINWWGVGPPPTERWPGVTIQIDDAGGLFRFDEDAANLVCDWFPKFCSHSKGQWNGKRFDLLDYQSELILRPLFGWVHARGARGGYRRFQKAYIQIPKKNGKTQMVAGLALYMLLADAEPGAEVYVAAADREQARILFRAAVAMVEANDKLNELVIIYRNQIVKRDDPTAFFQVMSSEASTKHGPNIHCLIVDELHAQPNRELFETLTRGTIARRQPLTILITTAGDDDESICAEEHDYAQRVLSGTIEDDSHLPVIFEADPNDDFLDPMVWAKVNPALDETVSTEALEHMAREAANEPRKRNDFLRFHLNRWVAQAEAWIPVEWWDRGQRELDESELGTLTCSAGLDLAQKWDLTAFVVVLRRMLAEADAETITVATDDGDVSSKMVALNYEIVCMPFFWIPEETMEEHEHKDGVPYTMWREAGLVRATEGRTIDYSRVYRDITEEIVPRFPMLKQGLIGYDPAFATDIATQLRDRKGLKTHEVLQNYQHLSETCQVFEAMVKAERVHHDGHRVLRNHIENVAVKMDDAKRMRPVKPKRASKHIDGVVAALMGLKGLMLTPPKKRTVGVYVA